MNQSIAKAVRYAITILEQEVESLDMALETNHYIPIQRRILEKKLEELKSDLKEFRSISL